MRTATVGVPFWTSWVAWVRRGSTPVVAGVVQLRSSSGWTFNPAEDKDYDEIPAAKRDILDGLWKNRVLKELGQ